MPEDIVCTSLRRVFYKLDLDSTEGVLFFYEYRPSCTNSQVYLQTAFDTQHRFDGLNMPAGSLHVVHDKDAGITLRWFANLEEWVEFLRRPRPTISCTDD